MYAGAIQRPGCNAEWQAVDARLVAAAPQSLDAEQTAALPLTAITAWEALFERLPLRRREAGRLLVIGGGGGVASMAVQLARQLTEWKVVGTAGRDETRQWLGEMGRTISSTTASH